MQVEKEYSAKDSPGEAGRKRRNSRFENQGFLLGYGVVSALLGRLLASPTAHEKARPIGRAFSFTYYIIL